ncbi:hypothetical protein NL676_010773 [Syzygium grande]|nr:hypothetical protein NL676_010773 [Syzygium grande]
MHGFHGKAAVAGDCELLGQPRASRAAVGYRQARCGCRVMTECSDDGRANTVGLRLRAQGAGRWRHKAKRGRSKSMEKKQRKGLG